jgi:hypothetical protein
MSVAVAVCLLVLVPQAQAVNGTFRQRDAFILQVR